VRTSLVLGSALVLVGLAVAGCGEDEDACEANAAELCDKVFECDSRAAATNYEDVESCRHELEQSCHTILDAPDVGETPGSIAACTHSLAKMSCDEFLYEPVPASCTVTPGKRAAGMACIVSSQCDSGVCLHEQGATCGACAILIEPGERCDGKAVCPQGMLCLQGYCAVPVLEGGACTDSDECSRTLACQSGVCAKLQEVGADCADNSACMHGTSCNEGLCEADRPAGEGEECGRLANGHLAVCTGGRVCGPNGKCLRRIEEGQSCFAPRGGCAANLRCMDGTCNRPDPSACEGPGPDVCFCSLVTESCETSLDDAGIASQQCQCEPACCCPGALD
jgi:hypothetical protein